MQLTFAAVEEVPAQPVASFPEVAARYISGAADLAATDGKLPARVPETARSQLAATLRRDADGLIGVPVAIAENPTNPPLTCGDLVLFGILVVNSGSCGEAEFEACQVAGSLPV